MLRFRRWLYRFDIDPIPDLVAQTPDGIVIPRGDGAGRFVHAVALPLGAAGVFADAGTPRIDRAIGFVASDARADLVVLEPGTNKVLILKGTGACGFAAPVRLPSGVATPLAAVVAQLIGNAPRTSRSATGTAPSHCFAATWTARSRPFR